MERQLRADAFDLIELNGNDLRREPFVVRKATLASLLGQEMIAGLLGSATPGLRFNEQSGRSERVPARLSDGP
jgi:ATP-dependent DNA ligase